MKKENIQQGDFVKVKKGIKDPNFEQYLISNWQGMVTGVEKDGLYMIKWDAQTLLDTPFEYLEKIMSGGYDHDIMRLTAEDLEKVNAPDKSRDTKKLKGKANLRAYLIGIFEIRAEKYIEIFDGLDTESEFKFLEKWEEYLDKILAFPFEAKVVEDPRGVIKYGDVLKVKKIVEADNNYGLLISGKHEGCRVIFPLCDLEVTDKKSDNYEIVDDYRSWFANR